MHLTICLIVLLFVAGFVNMTYAAKMAGDGNWGEALGQLTLGPLGLFLAAHALIYYGLRWLRGPAKLKSFTSTKISYIAFTLALLSILGSAVQRANPPM